jgi:hypothetical protein
VDSRIEVVGSRAGAPGFAIEGALTASLLLMDSRFQGENPVWIRALRSGGSGRGLMDSRIEERG